MTTTTTPRPLYRIAWDIANDWKKPYFGAVPYIEAMGNLSLITEYYGEDPGQSIVAYFLSNATTWKGETARRIKAELKDLLKSKAARR